MGGYSWGYASKENDLRSGLVLLIVLTATILAPLATPIPRIGLTALFVVLVLGGAGSEWLAALP